MKINNFKALSIVVCCFVIALCPEIQSMDIRSDQEEETNIKKQLKETKKELELKKYIRKLKSKEEKEKKEYEWEKPSDCDYFTHTHAETDVYKIEKNGEVRFHEVKKTTIFEESYKKELTENKVGETQECINNKSIIQNSSDENIYSEVIPDNGIIFTSVIVPLSVTSVSTLITGSFLPGLVATSGYLAYNHLRRSYNYSEINHTEIQKKTNSEKLNSNKNIYE